MRIVMQTFSNHVGPTWLQSFTEYETILRHCTRNTQREHKALSAKLWALLPKVEHNVAEIVCLNNLDRLCIIALLLLRTFLKSAFNNGETKADYSHTIVNFA